MGPPLMTMASIPRRWSSTCRRSAASATSRHADRSKTNLAVYTVSKQSRQGSRSGRAANRRCIYNAQLHPCQYQRNHHDDRRTNLRLHPPGLEMTRTGKDYLTRVRDGRTIFLDGQLVEDPVDHPAFRNAMRTIAGLYDFMADAEHQELMTFESPSSGDRVGRFWQLPKSYEELVQRREAIAAWAELTYGFLGRSPDHVASSLSGMVMGIELFEDHSPQRARALLDYFEYARDKDLFVATVIANPRAYYQGRQDAGHKRGYCRRASDYDGAAAPGRRREIRLHGGRPNGHQRVENPAP